MSDLIVIVGTCHVFQRPPPTRREEEAKLREYLVRLARRHNAKVVGEELSMESLRELERSGKCGTRAERSLSRILCARHSMSRRSIYAEQDETEECGDRGA